MIHASQTLITAANWTYWIAEFGVVTIVLAWTYVRHTDHYIVLRNALITTNVIGYVGYVLVPTAPPRLVPGYGFVDTLAGSSSLNQGTPIVAFAANRYAAMPSLHTADAIVLGVAVATLSGNRWARWLWLAWPAWVSFALIVTANHFWLDAAAGVLVAGLGGGIALCIERRAPPGRRRRCAARSVTRIVVALAGKPYGTPCARCPSSTRRGSEPPRFRDLVTVYGGHRVPRRAARGDLRPRPAAGELEPARSGAGVRKARTSGPGSPRCA